MEKYITELISENNRVIIPNFGAFIVSKEHGTSILFNNFLSFNDGLLVNHIAEQKGIDTIKATEQVFEYADTLKSRLEESGTLTFNKLGTFTKDESGILRFQQADDVSELFGQDAKLINTPSTDEDNSKQNDFLLDIDTEAEQSKIPTVETVFPKKEEAKPIVVESTIHEKVPPKISVTPPAGINHKNSDSEKVQLKKNVPSPNKPKKKNEISVLFLVTTIVILIAFGVYYLFFMKTKEPVPLVVKKEVVIPVVKTEAPKDTSALIENVDTPKTGINSLEKGYIYIIVGGFKDLGNAQNMVTHLQSEGNKNAQTFELDNMHLVSIDSGSSYRKMEARQQEILSNKIESWLYQVK